MLSHFSHVRFCATPQTAAHQAPLSLGFSSQEYWSGLPSPPPKDLPDPGIKPTSSASPALQAYSLTAEPLGKNYFIHSINRIYMSIPICQFILPFSHFGVHTFVLYAYVSIPALQIGSSVPLFQIPQMLIFVFVLLTYLTLYDRWQMACKQHDFVPTTAKTIDGDHFYYTLTKLSSKRARAGSTITTVLLQCPQPMPATSFQTFCE